MSEHIEYAAMLDSGEVIGWTEDKTVAMTDVNRWKENGVRLMQRTVSEPMEVFEPRILIETGNWPNPRIEINPPRDSEEKHLFAFDDEETEWVAYFTTEELQHIADNINEYLRGE